MDESLRGPSGLLVVEGLAGMDPLKVYVSASLLHGIAQRLGVKGLGWSWNRRLRIRKLLLS